jgi:PAS domain S-box-containing protein
MLEYDFAGTPGQRAVQQQGTLIYERDVRRHFPAQGWLAELNAEAYIGVPLLSASGDVIGLLVIVHDAPLTNAQTLAAVLEALAHRVGAELEAWERKSSLQRSETRLRRLVEYSRDVLFYYQLSERRFEYINPQIEELTGYPPEAFLANPAIALELLHPDDREKVTSAFRSGDEEPLVVRIFRTDGQMRWIEYRNFAFRDEEGRVIAICGTIRDSTRRLETIEALTISEAYRKALLDCMPDTLMRLTGDGTMLDYVSGEASRAFVNGTGELIGRNIRTLLPPYFFDPILQVTRAALQSERVQRLEFEVNTPNQTMTYEARCVPFHEGEALLILRDFTAVKWHEREEERRGLRDELDVKVERRRTNPYNLTYRELAILHLVAEGQADKQIAEALGISIYTVNKHVGNILGKMAASSRTEAGVRAAREGLVG